MLPYYPAFRAKSGEYAALNHTPNELKASIFPRLIIPPPEERDLEKGEPLTPDEVATFTGRRIYQNWYRHSAFIDTQFVRDFIGPEGTLKLFRLARVHSANLVAVATVDDLFAPHFRELVNPTLPGIGVYLRYEDIDIHRLLEGLAVVGCAPEKSVVFLDFADAPLDIPEAASSVAGAIEDLLVGANWHRIAFQGSGFPATNPAKEEGICRIPRTEWTSYWAAIHEAGFNPQQVCFGDYGADSGLIKFPKKKGGAPAIRHIRYTASAETIIVRGSAVGDQAEAMRKVCKIVVESSDYAGRILSYADDRLWEISEGIASSGNPTTWRELNTAHHIARVVHDLGARVGRKFAPRDVEALKQMNLPY